MKVSLKNLGKGISETMATKAFKKLPIETQINVMTQNVVEKINRKYEASKALMEAKYKVERLLKENPNNATLKASMKKINSQVEVMKVEIEKLSEAQKMLEAKKAEIRAQMAINEALRPLNDSILGGGDISIDNIFSDLEDLLHDQEDEVNAMLEVQNWAKGTEDTKNSKK